MDAGLTIPALFMMVSQISLPNRRCELMSCSSSQYCCALACLCTPSFLLRSWSLAPP